MSTNNPPPEYRVEDYYVKKGEELLKILFHLLEKMKRLVL